MYKGEIEGVNWARCKVEGWGRKIRITTNDQKKKLLHFYPLNLQFPLLPGSLGSDLDLERQSIGTQSHDVLRDRSELRFRVPPGRKSPEQGLPAAANVEGPWLLHRRRLYHRQAPSGSFLHFFQSGLILDAVWVMIFGLIHAGIADHASKHLLELCGVLFSDCNLWLFCFLS